MLAAGADMLGGTVAVLASPDVFAFVETFAELGKEIPVIGSLLSIVSTLSGVAENRWEADSKLAGLLDFIKRVLAFTMTLKTNKGGASKAASARL